MSDVLLRHDGADLWSPPAESVPPEAEVVVIGGGIIGCSVAYHLACQGVKEVVLLEQQTIAGGTTWHAAGLIGRLRSSNSLTQINKYSAELYARLESEAGVPTGWRQVGSLTVAADQDRMTQLLRSAAMAEWFGVEVELLEPRAAAERWPGLVSDDLVGAVWLPDDGKVRPELLTRALAKAATDRGVTIIEKVAVRRLIRRQDRVMGLETEQGVIRCRKVVICGGMWSRQLGLDTGIDIPLLPVEHHYVISEPVPEVHDDLPVLRDHAAAIYVRSRNDCVIVGAFQHRSKVWGVDRVADDFSYQLLPPDRPRFAEAMEAARHRLRILEAVEFPHFINGPESFTPDNQFMLGAVPELDGCYLAAGFNSAGIASAGGAGRELARIITQGRASANLAFVDPARFHRSQNGRKFLEQRVGEVLGLHYQMAWPNREFETARDLRRSPIHDDLSRRRACFGTKFGWERPNWFAEPDQEPRTEYSFQRQNWFDNVRREHQACSEHVGLIDQSSLGKLEVVGVDACHLLQQVCTSDLDVEPGRIVVTCMLNEHGGIESHLCVARLTDQRYYLITGTDQVRRDFACLRRAARIHEVTIRDISADWGVLGVVGPSAREVLGDSFDAEFDDGSFPAGQLRIQSLSEMDVWLLRLSPFGLTGWELHVSAQHMREVFQRIEQAAIPFQFRWAGVYATESLRLESRSPAWGRDITYHDHPYQAGLQQRLDWNRLVPFVGADALRRFRSEPLDRQLVSIAVDSGEVILWGNEPLRAGETLIGYTTSAAYGYSLGRSVAMAWIQCRVDGQLPDGPWQVNVAGQWHDVQLR